MQILKLWGLEKRPYICQRCEKLEFDPRVVSSTDDFDKPVAVLREYGEDLKFTSNCAMCHALKSICPPPDGQLYAYHLPNITTQFEVDTLVGKNATRQFLEVLERLNSTKWLAVKSNIRYSTFFNCYHRYGFLAEFTGESGHLRGPRVNHISSSEISYEKIRGWMYACIVRHSGVCTKALKSPIHHLKLIDCHSRLLVDWKPDFRYSALSYVWGVNNDGSGSQDENKLPPNLPQTIEDAMTVSMQLDIQYLWVDKYCIRGGSGEHKAEQIRNMHNIYRGAEITIIAVAGTDPHYGLPGVHPNRPRMPQVKISFRGHNLLSTGRGLRFLLEQSEWARRGWTLQEGLLSRRRLLFTDEQVFFECDQFHCCESIDLLPLNRHEQILGVSKLKYKKPELSPYHSSDRSSSSIYGILDDYMKRQLSHDHDILNAIRGILAYFEEEYPQKFRHLWGLPFFLRGHSRFFSRDDMDNVTKLLAHELLWYRIKPARRLGRFPSWSWTGWKGQIEYGLDIALWGGCPKSTEIQIQLDDGNFISCIRDLANLVSYREISRSISQFLVIKADTVDVQIRRREHIPQHDDHPILYPGDYWMWEGILVPPDVKNFVTQHLHQDQPRHVYGKFLHNELTHAESELYKKFDSSLIWHGIILQNNEGKLNMPGTMSVLVIDRVKDWWERVGTVRFKEVNRPLLLDDYVRSRGEFRLG